MFSGQVSIHTSPLRAGFLFYSFPGHIPHSFSKPGIWGAHFSCARSKGWGAWCRAWILHREKPIPLWHVLVVNHRSWRPVFFLGKTVSLPLLPVSLLSFYPLLWKLCWSSFQVPFQRNCSSCHCRFTVLMGGERVQDLPIPPSWTIQPLNSCNVDYMLIHIHCDS